MVKQNHELFKRLPGTDNRISQGRTYAGGDPSGVQGIEIHHTKMGKAAEGNGGLGEERAASKFSKDRS